MHKMLVNLQKRLKLKNDIQSKVRFDLDQQQREYFLQQQMKTIQEELGGATNEQEIEDMEVGDEADIATRSVEKEMLFELTDSEKQTLDMVEAALRKMEKGVYGTCESCHRGIPRRIPHNRRRARPARVAVRLLRGAGGRAPF